MLLQCYKPRKPQRFLGLHSGFSLLFWAAQWAPWRHRKVFCDTVSRLWLTKPRLLFEAMRRTETVGLFSLTLNTSVCVCFNFFSLQLIVGSSFSCALAWSQRKQVLHKSKCYTKASLTTLEIKVLFLRFK